MKLAAAQMCSAPGKIDQNIAKHLAVIEQAIGQGAEGIFFPELSLTGYQPTLAAELALDLDDPRLDVFEALSNRAGALIAVGAPLRATQGIQIALFVFQPGSPRLAYSKQLLHSDELPYFCAGAEPRAFSLAQAVWVPAICYESLQASHAQQAAQAQATFYCASVANSARGVAAAYDHYPHIARQHGMTVIMANCVGPADDYIAAGGSGVWSPEGHLLVQAGETEQALILYDSLTREGRVVSLQDAGQAGAGSATT